MTKRNTYFQDEVITKKVDIKQLGKILRYVLPYKKTVILVAVLMLLSSFVSMVSPLLLKKIINEVVVNEDYRELAFIIAGMAVLAIIEIGTTFIHQRQTGIMGHKVIASIRQDIFYKLQKLPFDYFDSRPDGKIGTRQ